MKCEKVQKNLSAYVDGEVGLKLRQRMEEHLAGCPACAAERDAIERIAAAASSSVRLRFSEKEAPHEIRAEVMRRLAQSPARRVVVLPARRLVAAAALGVLVGGLLVGFVLESGFRSQRQALRAEIEGSRAELAAARAEKESARTELSAARAALSVVEEELRLAQQRINETTRLASRAPRDERYAWRPVLSSLQMPGARALLENGLF
jgi:anti-sigma factor (TIGR02949 family)